MQRYINIYQNTVSNIPVAFYTLRSIPTSSLVFVCTRFQRFNAAFLLPLLGTVFNGFKTILSTQFQSIQDSDRIIFRNYSATDQRLNWGRERGKFRSSHDATPNFFSFICCRTVWELVEELERKRYFLSHYLYRTIRYTRNIIKKARSSSVHPRTFS